MTKVEQEAAPTRRVALTKAQSETEVGAELLSLCQTVTADDSLSEAEVASLREWLGERRGEDLPAISRLIPVVERIVAAARVARDECRELFMAIETLLPPDLRGVAKAARRTIEEREEERTRLDKELQKHVRDERARNRPIARLEFMVAGSRFDGRPATLQRFARDSDPAFLVRDAGNGRSRNATQVRIAGGHQIGFVPEEIASDLAPLLEGAHPYTAEIRKILAGGRSPIPVVVAVVYRTDSTVVDIVRPDEPLDDAQLPAATGIPAGSGLLWKAALALLAVAALIYYWT
jgi:hypothetical protein